MPGQFPIDIVAYGIKDVQAHTAVLDKLAVADDIFQIPYRAQFEEHHRVDALLAAFSIISLGERIKEVQVDDLP